MFLTCSIHVHHVTEFEAINIPRAVQMPISGGWCSSDSVSLLQRELGNALIHHGYWDPQRVVHFHIHCVFTSSVCSVCVCVSSSEDQRGLQAWAKACQGHPVSVWQAETVLLAAVSISELKSNPLDLLKLFTPVDWQLSAACWFAQCN